MSEELRRLREAVLALLTEINTLIEIEDTRYKTLEEVEAEIVKDSNGMHVIDLAENDN